MDETTLNELRELAEQNGIDPDRLLAIAGADGLPEELSAAMADILGELTIFGQALDEKGRLTVPRLFIGIGLPDAYRQSLKPFTKRLSELTDASVNWSRPDTWHLTLKFLGETDEARIPALKTALAAVDFTAFTLRAGGAGAFPETRRPKVLWLGLTKGAEQAAALARSIEDALAAIDIPREEKPFRPHLTLGRIRKPAPGDWTPVLDAAAAHPWPPFTVTRFTLWQSTLTPEGAIHTPLAEFPAQ